MSNALNTIHLLITDHSTEEAERKVNVLRNNGIPTRATFVSCKNELIEQLQKRTWDLYLAPDHTEQLDAEEIINQIKRLEKDVPLIVLKEYSELAAIRELLQLGVEQIIPPADDDILLNMSKKTLDHVWATREIKKMKLKLQEIESRCTLLLESSRDAIAYITDGMHIHVNLTYAELFGLNAAEEMTGQPILDLIDASHISSVKELLKKIKNGDIDKQVLKILMLHSQEGPFEVEAQFSQSAYDGEPCLQIMVIRAQAPQQKEALEIREKLSEIHNQDLATGCYTKNALIEATNTAVEKALQQGIISSLFYLSLHHIRQTLELIGLTGLDIILGEIASIIRHEAPKDAFIAILSNDAFAVLTQKSDLAELDVLGENLSKKISEHLIEIDTKTYRISTSIGIAIINENTPSAGIALNKALQTALEIGKDERGVKVFVSETKKPQNLTKTAVRELQKLIDNNLFRILFQPIISLRGADHEFYEVLLRMVNADGTEVSPGSFLADATQANTASIVDRWVIIQTIKTLSEHIKKGHSTRVIINLTAQSICDKSFLPWLLVAFNTTEIPKNCIIFQLSENDVTTHLKQVKEFFEALRQLKCQSSISRFGCAVDPMECMKHASSKYVKLDGSFAMEIENTETREKLTNLIKELHTLGKQTIIPFVEKASVLSPVWQTGAYYIQGYFLQPPGPAMNYDFSKEE